MIETILFTIIALIGIFILYIEHKIKTKNNAEIYNNLKKLDDDNTDKL
tara:strand:+ start:177 stop:320 length:144 start_codon:yes stop_codon:yes gene_type:complete